MSIGLTTAFINAKSSLSARQMEMNLVSNNIAKSSLENYHRQTSVLSSSATLLTNSGYFGTGVVSSLVRSYDVELENNLRLAMNSDGYAQSYYGILSQMESVIATKGESPLASAMSAFADSIQNLANSPESTSYRSAVISAASTLASQFNQQYESLRQIRDGVAYSKDTSDPYAVGGTVVDITNKINSLLDQLPQMNDSISLMETNAFLGQTANDLRDERDAVIKELSQYLNVTVTEDSESKYKVSIFDSTGTEIVLINPVFEKATPAANHITATLDTSVDPQGILAFEVTDGVTGVATPLSLADESGSLKGLLDAREGIIKTQMADLYTYAQNVTTTVNALLNAGEDLDGNAGANLFTAVAAQPAKGSIMLLSSTITNRQLAASNVDPTDPTLDVECGNGENMKAIWSALNEEKMIGGTTDTLLRHANTMVSEIAQATSEYSSKSTTSKNTVTMFQNAILNSSGVDLDQEMTTMLTVQQAYQATSKMIATINNMYDMIFSLI